MKVQIQGLEVSVPLSEFELEEGCSEKIIFSNKSRIEFPPIFFKDKKFGFFASDKIDVWAETPEEVEMLREISGREILGDRERASFDSDRRIRLTNGDQLVIMPRCLKIAFYKKHPTTPQS